MKNTFLSLLLAAGVLFCAAGIAKAQNTVTPLQSATSYALLQNEYDAEVTAEQASSNVRILSGCLDEGATANEYTLYGEFPNSWELRSDSVYLVSYVGETIRITVLKKPSSDGTYLVTDVSSVIMATCVR